MASFVLRNAFVSIDTVDLSDHCREVAVELTADDVDVTAMGAGGHGHLAGIRDDKFTFTFYSDFAAGKVDATIQSKFAGGTTPFYVHVGPNNSTASATNPIYIGTCFLLTYNPVSGAVGDAAMTPLEFVVQGTISSWGTASVG
jgi:hypothetical protein